MAESNAFSVTCEALERETSFDRLEARGTVRLALKRAGLDPASVSGHEMTVVVAEILTAELETRGVLDAASVCERIRHALASVQDERAPSSPEAVFARLGGSA